MGFSAKISETTSFKMTFQDTKNMSNCNKAVNIILI